VVVADLVEIAFVPDEFQGKMIQALLEEHEIPSMVQQVTPSGPQLGYGLMNPEGGARRVMVHAEKADRARTLVETTMAEQDEAPEPVNAGYLEDAAGGRGPRNYNVIGAYARAYLVAFVVFALIFGVWLLFRVL
jgi:Putative prokaryotic signal transducing protein